MDEKYRGLFFDKLMHKFVNDIKYLEEETIYKILWSFLRAERLHVREDSYEWVQVKMAIKERCKEFGAKTLTDIIILSAVAKEKGHKDGFWEVLEIDVMLKMKEMSLNELTNLLWSAVEVDKGSKSFHQELEEQIMK